MRSLRGKRLHGAAALALCALALTACNKSSTPAGLTDEASRPIHRFDHLQAVAQSGSTLVAVGAFGVVAVSTDDGAHWSRHEMPGAPALIKTAACGDGSFVALDFNGALWVATDKAAASWTSAKVPAEDALLDLTCSGENIWIVGARGAILTSADKGGHWESKSLDEDIQLLNIQFPTRSFGVITGEFGRVLLSQDGGANWAEGGSLGPDFYPQGMTFADEHHGVVVGLGGAVLETADGGKTWTHGKAPTEAPLYGVAADGDGNVLVVGAVGTAFERGAADRWQPVAGLPLTDLRGIALTPSHVVLAGAGLLSSLPRSAMAQNQH